MKYIIFILLFIIAALIVVTFLTPILLSLETNNLKYLLLYFIIGIPIVIEVMCFVLLFNIFEK